MTNDKAEYIKNWLFRANEDIAVIGSLVNAGYTFIPNPSCIVNFF